MKIRNCLLLTTILLSACHPTVSRSPGRNLLLVDFNSRGERKFWRQIGPGLWRIRDGHLLVHNKEQRRRVAWEGLPCTYLLMRRAFNSHHISVQVEVEVLEIIAPYEEEPGIGIQLTLLTQRGGQR